MRRTATCCLVAICVWLGPFHGPLPSQADTTKPDPSYDKANPNYDKANSSYDKEWAEEYDPYKNYRENSYSTDRRIRHQGSISLTVPVFLTEDIDVVRPGFGFDFRYGIDFGYLVPELAFGFGRNSVDLNEAGVGRGREPLRSISFSLGLRLQFPNRSIALPYISGSFDMNWWNFLETDIVCDPFYCFSVDAYRFTPGFTFRAGNAFFLARTVALDVGVRLSLSFEGDFFRENEVILGPYLGLTFRSL